MVSYELSLGLSIMIPVMIAGSLDLNTIVAAQNGGWFIILNLPAGILFFIAALAELQRAPFDLLEAEQELSSGYNVEYAGMRFAMFMMAEYVNMIIFSAIWVTLFWGGYMFLGITEVVPLLGILIFVVKIFLSLFLMIWVRASLPRLRYDQLMSFGWKFMLPVSVLNVIVTGIFLVLRAEGII
jgi:NADH-quinone oxidoreductase subunit H